MSIGARRVRRLHELKYDGYRMHAPIEEGQVKLLTRTGLDWSHRYRSTIEALPSLEMSLSAAPIQDGNTSRPHRGGQVGTVQALPKAAILLFAMMTATVVLSLALPASAQDKVFCVGLLTNGKPPKEGQQSTWRSGVLLGLDSGGYRLGRNLEQVERYSEGRADRLPGMAREIAATNVNVVVAVADPSVQAMMTATQSTPIVMMVGADPVERGFVASVPRPGGRVTGLSFQTFEGDVKRLQILREAMPAAHRFGRLAPPGPIPKRASDLLVVAASALNIELTSACMFYVAASPATAAALVFGGPMSPPPSTAGQPISSRQSFELAIPLGGRATAPWTRTRYRPAHRDPSVLHSVILNVAMRSTNQPPPTSSTFR